MEQSAARWRDRRTAVRVGISGWRYPPWRGSFYPPGLVQRRELEYASHRLDSIEINGTFYGLQRPARFLRWRDEVPGGFVFSVKGSNLITHRLRLKNTQAAVGTFFASGVLALQEKLGPILWQLPPSSRFDPEILNSFLSSLPHSIGEAKRTILQHSRLDADSSWTDTTAEGTLRHALEVRNDSFLDAGFFQLLRDHDIAVVVADTAGRWPDIRELTSSSMVYVRLHGNQELYVSGYDDSVLEEWAQTIRGWSSGDGCPDGRGRDVFVYFDNDVKVRAPYDAIRLRKLLGLDPSPEEFRMLNPG